MACSNNCNNCNNCNNNCNDCYTNINPTGNLCCPDPCGCKTTLSALCVNYLGIDLPCTGINSGTNLESLLIQLDSYLCFLLNEINNNIINTNVGGEAESFVQKNLNGEFEFRTHEGSTSVDITQNLETIAYAINEAWLTTFIGDLIPDGIVETPIVSVGTGNPIYLGTNGTPEDEISSLEQIGTEGIDVYKGFNAISKNHEFKKIKSPDIIVSEDVDGEIELSLVAEELITEFFVNNAYTGTEELGTSVKPFKTLDLALQTYLGTGTIDAPEFQGRTIRVFNSGTDYDFSENVVMNGLTLNREDGVVLNYVGTRLNYDSSVAAAIDTTDLANLTTGTTTFNLEGSGEIISNLGVVVRFQAATAGGSLIITTNGETLVESRYVGGAVGTYETSTPGVNYKAGATDIIFYQGTDFSKPAVEIIGESNGGFTLNNGGMFQISSYTQPLLNVSDGAYISSNNITLKKGGTYAIADYNPGTKALEYNNDWYAISIPDRGRIETKTLNISSSTVHLVENLYKLNKTVGTTEPVNQTSIRVLEGGQSEFDGGAITGVTLEGVNNEFLVENEDVTLFYIGYTDLSDTETSLIRYLGANYYVPTFINSVFSTPFAKLYDVGGNTVDLTDNGAFTRINTFAGKVTITGALDNVTLNFANFTNAATFNGSIFQLNNLPTSLPGTANQLWNDGGTVKIS